MTAFSCAKPIEDLNVSLNKFNDYKHEQEKLLVYNVLGRAVVANSVGAEDPGEQLIADAKLALAFAKEVGVGVEMWEWLVKRFESLPLDHLSRERFDIKNGFYF